MYETKSTTLFAMCECLSFLWGTNHFPLLWVCTDIDACDLLRVLKTSEKCITCKCNSCKRAIVGKVHGDKWNKQIHYMKMFAINFMDGSCCSIRAHIHALRVRSHFPLIVCSKKKICIDSEFVYFRSCSLYVSIIPYSKIKGRKDELWVSNREG